MHIRALNSKSDEELKSDCAMSKANAVRQKYNFQEKK